MKRSTIVLCILVSLLVFTSCGVKRISKNDSDKSESVSQTTAIVDENSTESLTNALTYGTEKESESQSDFTVSPSIPAGIYNMVYSEGGIREDYELLKSYKDDSTHGRDLCVLGCFPSTEEKLSGKNMGEIWDNCIQSNSLSDNVRSGYLLEFDTPSGKCEKLIIRPSDITAYYWEYIETYIYDDIHQKPGEWYSHLLDNQFTDETIITSVKITAGEKIRDVTAITLTVFMYEISDRDSIGIDYARLNGYSIDIIPDPTR